VAALLPPEVLKKQVKPVISLQTSKTTPGTCAEKDRDNYL
jgi:hypothetical protein